MGKRIVQSDRAGHVTQRERTLGSTRPGMRLGYGQEQDQRVRQIDKTRWWLMVTHLQEGVQLQLQACAGVEPPVVLLLLEVVPVPVQCFSSTPMRLLGARCPQMLF
ncbi:hypothetical protein ZWY2020_011077 [Hordeum vulgare]|nr:hypothetical protein ZWY2020_011077 [Hordeum vulgare]